MSDIKKFDNTHRINRIVSEMDSLYHQVALKLKLSDSALFILYTIYDNGGRYPLNKINDAGICKQTINSAIRKLESTGILYLEPYKGKSKMVVLTEKGIDFASKTVAHLLNAEEKVYSTWTQEEIDLYIRLSIKFTESFGTQVKEIPVWEEQNK